jgi:hypothetical protein
LRTFPTDLRTLPTQNMVQRAKAALLVRFMSITK